VDGSLQISHIKKLVEMGCRKFEPRIKYPDKPLDGKSYDQILLEYFSITEEEAWNLILSIHMNMIVKDYRPNYAGSDAVKAIAFKRKVNGEEAYIKVKVEEGEDGEEVVCISFHPDW